MPIDYERDDERQLITVTITEPYSVDGILAVIEQQMAENAWESAMLHDMRTTTHLTSVDDARRITARVQALSGDRTRGPVGMAINPKPQQLREGLKFAELTKNIVTLEVLLTTAQLDDWLARNAPRRKPQP